MMYNPDHYKLETETSSKDVICEIVAPSGLVECSLSSTGAPLQEHEGSPPQGLIKN